MTAPGWEILAYDICRAVGIAHANMAPCYQEDLALDYFIQALAGTDTGALLTIFRPENLQKAADAAARWEAAKPPAREAERYALVVRQVGPVDNRAPGAGVGLGSRVELEEIVQDMVDRRLAGSGPWQAAHGRTRGGPSPDTPIRNEGGIIWTTGGMHLNR